MKVADPPPPEEAAHEGLTQSIRRALELAKLPRGKTLSCPYLPGRVAQWETVRLETPSGLYHSFMDLNFRRLGDVFYRPRCQGCAECLALRVLVAEFRASRSQRRSVLMNSDLTIELGPPRPTAEKHALYRRYLTSRHDGQMDGSLAEFQGFLYASPIDTVEVVYRLEQRIVAVGIVDREPLAWSAVYCYYEPSMPARSLGAFNILTLLDECRRKGVRHLYLGYYVAGCAAMSYKARFRPCEVLNPNGEFSPLRGAKDGGVTS